MFAELGKWEVTRVGDGRETVGDQRRLATFILHLFLQTLS